MTGAATLNIRTPEGVTFSLPLAGPVIRGLAWVIDSIIIVVSWILLSIALGGVLSALPGSMDEAVVIMIGFLITTGYGMFLEWIWNGRTIGKRLLGIRVMDERGLSLTLGQIVIRNLMRAADMPFGLFFAPAGIATVLTKRCQRLGDLAAGTVVIRSAQIREPNLDTILAGKYNSFRDHPVLEARLRQKVTPQEAWLALSALLRREELGLTDRIHLYQELAGYFRGKVQFPESVLVGLSDEQYLRNVVESLFRRRASLDA